jgi:hypothetical protein
MSRVKRIVEENKIPKYLQSVVKKERRETPRSEPQRNQTDSQFIDSGNSDADRILEVSGGGCKITTDALFRVGDVIKFQCSATIRGRVVWNRMGVFGIEFID